MRDRCRVCPASAGRRKAPPSGAAISCSLPAISTKGDSGSQANVQLSGRRSVPVGKLPRLGKEAPRVARCLPAKASAPSLFFARSRQPSNSRATARATPAASPRGRLAGIVFPWRTSAPGLKQPARKIVRRPCGRAASACSWRRSENVFDRLDGDARTLDSRVCFQRIGERSLGISASVPEPTCFGSLGEQAESGEVYRAHQADQTALPDAFGHVVGLRGGLEVQVIGSAVQTELERAHVFPLPACERGDLPPPVPCILPAVVCPPHVYPLSNDPKRPRFTNVPDDPRDSVRDLVQVRGAVHQDETTAGRGRKPSFVGPVSGSPVAARRIEGVFHLHTSSLGSGQIVEPEGRGRRRHLRGPRAGRHSRRGERSRIVGRRSRLFAVGASSVGISAPPGQGRAQVSLRILARNACCPPVSARRRPAPLPGSA